MKAEDTSLTRINGQIHSRESRLWHIAKAEQGAIPYVYQYKDEKKRQTIRERVEKELIPLYDQRDKFKQTIPKADWYPNKRRCGKTKGVKNHFWCSDNTRVTQLEIDKLRGAAYIQNYNGHPHPMVCQGCGERYSNGSAHIIAQARCKQLRKTELIWHTGNFFPACFKCNTTCENVSAEGITKLKNFAYIKSFMEQHDPERASKLLT